MEKLIEEIIPGFLKFFETIAFFIIFLGILGYVLLAARESGLQTFSNTNSTGNSVQTEQR